MSITLTQRQALLGIPSLFDGTRRRADALMFVEYKGIAARPPGGAVSPVTSAGQGGMVPVTPRR